ncbi:hypothetical protein [Nonomuraea sp. SYSU D8015]|uniref:hypothetical protein n=1 Tax=Nonomuraea sp. SYSU D8015 TaxID=2593644 RepID=UPI00166177BB|nr:hypothetical protein [Nonomuraea sp. SYSU D8015]
MEVSYRRVIRTNLGQFEWEENGGQVKLADTDFPDESDLTAEELLNRAKNIVNTFLADDIIRLRDLAINRSHVHDQEAA